MRILFFDFEVPDLLKDNRKPTGGACVRINALAQGLQAIGHNAGVLTWTGANAFINKPVPYKLVEAFPRSGGIRFLRKLYYNYYLTKKAARSFSADIIFTKGNAINTGILAMITKSLGLPVGYLVTNDKDVDERASYGQSSVTRIFFNYALRNTALFICQNQYQMACLKKRFPDAAFKLLHNPYYSDKTLLPVRPLSERGYIAWVGIFSYQKNLPALLKVAESLPEYEFRVAGTMHNGRMPDEHSGLDNASLEAYRALRSCSNVQFTGFLARSEINDFLSGALLLLNTSHFEGFSNTFLEAFASGTPVVTRKEIDPDDVIARHGLGVVTSGYEEFPGAIRDLLQKPDYNGLARHCQQYLEKHHTKEFIAEQLSEAITATLSQISTPPRTRH